MKSLNLQETPEMFDIFKKQVVDQHGQNINFSIQELAGDEYGALFRAQSYRNCDLILILFSLVDPNSFAQVNDFFKEFELENIPRVLIGTKADLRENEKFVEELGKNGIHPISTEQGEQRAREYGYDGYLEVDCVSQNGFPDFGVPQDSLETCLKFALNNIRTKKPTPKK
jgi:Ras-related C3 botulinum toxin substrate 1